MSARRTLDAYDTPDALAAAIVRRVAGIAGVPCTILEPTAGGGAFVRACRAEWPRARIGAVDIDPARAAELKSAGADTAITADILTAPPAAIARANLIIGNPPYRDAEEILLHLLDALTPAGAACAMLLPVGFLGSKERHDPEGVFARFPLRYLAPIVPRPSFTADGKTDRMEYAIFGWGGLPKGIGSAIHWRK